MIFHKAKWIWVKNESKPDTYGDFMKNLYGKMAM